MLIQPNGPSYISVSPLAISRPVPVETPKASPCSIIRRQSAATWFHPGSADSGNASGMRSVSSG